MKHIDFAKVMGWLGFVLRCPICNTKYQPENIKVLESQHDEGTGEARVLIHSDCRKCKSSVMFNIDISGAEVFTVMAVTDLTRADTVKFSNRQPLSADDVLTVHKAIRRFDGDFVKALR